MSEIITKDALRNYLVRYQLLSEENNLTGVEGAKTVFRRLGSVQYDPLDVAGRNADLVLQARVDRFTPDTLQGLLYRERYLVDGYDKEMCIYRAEEYPQFAPIRKAHAEAVERTLAYRGQLGALDILDDVRDFVSKNGPTCTGDISIGAGQSTRWGHKKLSSAALDYLYNTGELCVAEKRGTRKYFAPAKDVLGETLAVDQAFQDEEAFLDFYVKRRVACVGALWNKRGGAWLGHFLGDSAVRQTALDRLCTSGELRHISVEGIAEPFYVPGDASFEGDVGKRVSFLAPLDNLLWDRALVSQVFGFDYSWEVYVPEAKRKYGYYVLPVLYGNRLIARFEPVRRQAGHPFQVKRWWWEPDVPIDRLLLDGIQAAFERFAGYLDVPNDPDNMGLVKVK